MLSLAVAVGFEPTVDFHPHTLSSCEFAVFSHVREAVWRPAMPTKDVRARGRTSANETKTETRSGVPTGPTSSRDVPRVYGDDALRDRLALKFCQCGGGVDCRGQTIAGLASARARGRTGAGPGPDRGRPFTMTPAKVRLAMSWMGKPDTKVSELCKELGVSRQTLYRQCLARRRRSAGWRAGARPKVRGPKRPTAAESRTLRPSP